MKFIGSELIGSEFIGNEIIGKRTELTKYNFIHTLAMHVGQLLKFSSFLSS